MPQSARSRGPLTRASRSLAVAAACRLLAVAAACLAVPAAASAHGPVAPAASRWQARVTQVPAGLHAQAVDGDLRLWLRVAPSLTAYVIDYRGGRYLRFSPAGVFVNRDSPMWYINQVPPVAPPLSLGPHAQPNWYRVSSGHAYLWQEGRMQALSRTVLAPGSDDAGRWSVPVIVDGRAQRIVGSLYHRPDPSPVWFWPIVVALACVLAGLRLRRPALDRRMAASLGVVALAGFAVAAVGHQLHGRPAVSVGQLVVLGVELAFTGWALAWLARGRRGWIVFFVIAGATLWQGISLAATLTDGYVLLATGPLLGRLAASACLAAGTGLLPIVFVMAERGAVGRGRAGAGAGAGDGDGDGDGEASPHEDGVRTAAGTPSAWEPTA